MRIALLAIALVGCAVAVEPSEPVRCSRTAESAAGTCAEDLGPGYVCGGDGFHPCEPGSEYCDCHDDGRCGAATCVPAD